MGNAADAGIRVSREGPALQTRYDGERGGYDILLAWKLVGREERTDVTDEWLLGFVDAYRKGKTGEKLGEHIDMVVPRRSGIRLLLKKDAPRQIPKSVVDVLDDVCRRAYRLRYARSERLEQMLADPVGR